MTDGIGSGITEAKLRGAIARLETERSEMVVARRTPYEIQKKTDMLLELRRRLLLLEEKA